MFHVGSLNPPALPGKCQGAGVRVGFGGSAGERRVVLLKRKWGGLGAGQARAGVTAQLSLKPGEEPTQVSTFETGSFP